MSRADDEREEVQEPEEIDFREYDLHGNYLGDALTAVPRWITDDQNKAALDSLGDLENPPESS